MVVCVEQEARQKLLVRARAAVDGPRKFIARAACTIAEKFCHLYNLELPLGFGDGPRHSAHPQTSCPDTSHPSADSQLSMTRI